MKKHIAFTKIDFPLFILMILYVILGLIMILSASSVSAVLRYKYSTYHFFIRQFIVVIGAFIIGIFLILRFKTKTYEFFTPFLVVGILSALVGLFFKGIIIKVGMI